MNSRPARRDRHHRGGGSAAGDDGRGAAQTDGDGGGGQDTQFGVALVSILVSIMLSAGFGVYSATSVWWLAGAAAIVVPTVLAVLINIGGRDGLIPKVGHWLLTSADDRQD